MMKAGKTFTLDELMLQLRKDRSDITEEEAYCSIEVLCFTGYLERVSKDIFRATGKEPPKQ